MPNDVEPSVAELVMKLDPYRDYGMPGVEEPLTYDQVVKGIYEGRFLIAEGTNLPVIRDAATNWPLRGSGMVIKTSSGPQQAALAEFRRMALDDVDFAYRNLISGMRRGDPRYDKIFWENLVGKMGENRGGDAVAEAFKALIEAMKQPETREVIVQRASDA